MAQEIMVAGAIYEDVPSVRLPDSHGTFHPFTDTSDTTAVAADVAQGKTFHLADGSAATGTAAGATLVTKSITANGTYSAEDDDADGYSEVTVNVSGGGGGGGADPKDVNFIDYDGTVVYAYTAAEFAALTALPENPTHAGLVAQGWNWSLADAQERVADTGVLVVGQMYVTASGATEIDFELFGGRLSPTLAICVNGAVEIDWGDGSATDTLTGSSSYTVIGKAHTYPREGKYTISVAVTSGEMRIYGNRYYYCRLLSNGTANTVYDNQLYGNSITAVRLGNGCKLYDYAFSYAYGIETVTLPEGLSDFNVESFRNCRSLKALTLPSAAGGMSLGTNLFMGCFALRAVSLPKNVTDGAGYTFSGCQSLSLVDMHAGRTYNYEYNETGVEIASFPTGCTRIGSTTFVAASKFRKVVVPTSVTTIDGNAFQSVGLEEIHFRRTTPPTSASSSWGIPTDCKIYVPAGTLSAYTSATNYPDPNTYTYVEE